MTWRAALAFALAAALPAHAETPLSAEAFEALATGRTLSYALEDRVYGVETYRPGRRVVFAFTDQDCREGYWYQDGDAICFVYEDPSDPQCWHYYQRSDGLWAQFIGDDPLAPLSRVDDSQAPLACPGPEVGV